MTNKEGLKKHVSYNHVTQPVPGFSFLRQKKPGIEDGHTLMFLIVPRVLEAEIQFSIFCCTENEMRNQEIIFYVLQICK